MPADLTDSARAEIERAVKRSPESMSRRAGSTAILTLLAAAALTPAVVAAAGGGPLTAAIAGIAGGIGSGQVTNLVQRCAERVRGRSGDDLAEAAQAALGTELAG